MKGGKQLDPRIAIAVVVVVLVAVVAMGYKYVTKPPAQAPESAVQAYVSGDINRRALEKIGLGGKNVGPGFTPTTTKPAGAR
jgi:hypothetical protein